MSSSPAAETPKKPQSVAGLDLGATLCRITQLETTRKMPIVQRNSLSNEATPSSISFVDGDIRQFGEGAVAKELSRSANTVGSLLDLVAGGAAAGARLKKRGAGVADVDAFAASPAVNMGGEEDISAERLLSFAMENLLAFGSTGGSKEACKLALTVPLGVSTDAAKSRLQAAAQLCDFSAEQILVVDDTTAAAAYFHHLQYDNLPKAPVEGEEAAEPQEVVIVNIGHRTSSAIYASARQGHIKVVSQAGVSVGSSQADEAIAEHVFEHIKTKKNLDVTTHVKSHNKVYRECRKTKEMLSTTDSCTCQLESLKDDTDVQLKITRNELEQLCQESLIGKLAAMLKELNVPAEVIASGKLRVEAIGGGWRSPFVQNCIKVNLGCAKIGVSLDSNLAIAEGAAIYAAIALSKETPAPAESEEENTKEETDAKSPTGFHAAHTLELVLPESASTATAASDAQIVEWKKAEQVLIEKDDILKARLAAKDKLESLLLQRRDIMPSVEGLTAEAKKDFEEKFEKAECWIWDDCPGQDGEPAPKEEIYERYEALKADVDGNEFFAKYFEAEKEIQRQKDAELERLSKLQDEDKELKSDPQRLRGAQQRREQGATLFKDGCYEDSRTRFVQALTILGQLYDTANEDTAAKKKEISLSCHLNIASCSIKTGNWKVALNNATSALDYNPEHGKAFFRRGQAKRQLHDYKGSRADLEKAKELTGGDAGVVGELEALSRDEALEKSKEKQMFGKMFS